MTLHALFVSFALPLAAFGNAGEPTTPAARSAVPPLAVEGLSLWKDPAFRRRFEESYLAETEIEPRVTTAERELIQDVSERLGKDQRTEALALLHKRRDAGSSAVIDFLVGNIHFEMDENDRAAEAYTVAVDKYPKFLRAWKMLGTVRARQDDAAAAVGAFTRVVELGGGNSLVYGLLGVCHTKLGDPVAAESAFRLAIMLDPLTLDWKMGLARAFFDQKRYADLAALCEALIARSPDKADLWLLQANAFIGLDRRQEAIGNLELVDQLGASTPDSLLLLGDLYVNDELFAPALEAYQRALATGAHAAVVRSVRALPSLIGRGATAEAHALLDGLDALPEGALDEQQHKGLLKLRAKLAMAEGAGNEEVLRVLEEIVRLDPLDGEALLLLGQHHDEAGNHELAIFYFERAASLPDFEAEAKRLHAVLLVSERRYNEALPLLKRALDLTQNERLREYVRAIEQYAQR